MDGLLAGYFVGVYVRLQPLGKTFMGVEREVFVQDGDIRATRFPIVNNHDTGCQLIRQADRRPVFEVEDRYELVHFSFRDHIGSSFL
ncbi:hypothetical protein TRIP_B220027 [uncultured Desulfatiglans sp.]|nr:hypothetical protein TRIP_B220027 [uncultured Desulfatiglans sp.]